LAFIFEHTPILKQLPDFSSCRDFGTYPGFETITGIHINVNFQAFMHLRNKARFFDEALRNQNIIIICSYSIKLTRNAENCLFKMFENKSSIF